MAKEKVLYEVKRYFDLDAHFASRPPYYLRITDGRIQEMEFYDFGDLAYSVLKSLEHNGSKRANLRWIGTRPSRLGSCFPKYDKVLEKIIELHNKLLTQTASR